jgi:hypothetical protein
VHVGKCVQAKTDMEKRIKTPTTAHQQITDDVDVLQRFSPLTICTCFRQLPVCQHNTYQDIGLKVVIASDCTATMQISRTNQTVQMLMAAPDAARRGAAVTQVRGLRSKCKIIDSKVFGTQNSLMGSKLPDGRARAPP